jgi:hypothetical protein
MHLHFERNTPAIIPDFKTNTEVLKTILSVDVWMDHLSSTGEAFTWDVSATALPRWIITEAEQAHLLDSKKKTVLKDNSSSSSEDLMSRGEGGARSRVLGSPQWL